MGELPRIRVSPEDFQVEEIPAYRPSGEGGHLLVRIEKKNQTTDAVAAALARAAGKARRDIGYAGRKDRNAVTRQWFSVEGVSPESAMAFDLPGAKVLEADRHPHKLRTGHLSGNRFRLVVREVPDGLAEEARRRFLQIVESGMPNRYGDQRYGLEGRNIERGIAILTGQRAPRDRRAARFEVSAVQSAVFDLVLRERPLPLDRLELGDVARVEESGGLFVVDDVGAASERASRFEISPTGPIFGTKVIEPQGEPAERERAAHRSLGIPLPGALQAPRGIRLRGTRRPLRVRPRQAQFERGPDQTIQIDCVLPPGSYATVFIQELVGDFDESPGIPAGR
ncbi:tRNA pseudouridine(13) synthase TruD [Myxococcota bacterium]|nr:tRNA pseudouridine(13) synthase TruD [Myxococcota bacterium]